MKLHKLLPGALAAVLATSAQADYRAVEATPTHEGDLRTRAVLNHTQPINDSIRAQYHGVVETNNVDLSSLFGVHNISVGNEHAQVGVRAITTQNGIDGVMGSIRSHSLASKIADFGFFEIASDGKDAVVRGLLSYDLGDGYGLDLFSSQNFGQNGRYNHTEVQGYKWLNDKTALTLRAEIPNGNVNDTTVLAGALYRF